ncbi:YgdI/YgdR family lipoprotein [Sodalis sp. dw_96]|uniref:YgdI/YgdR family lipoprotein n=1 Tax=Sodalis sp. dw_96 TaxID=2719794 RepID=UPI001BD2B7B6|nr:YgdI/YgdR family lipoprotein [Sodalis sp. dw_96]
MKTVLCVLSVVMFSAFLVGCSSNYAMSTNDGRIIVSDGKPKVDNETGMISYTNAGGTEQQISTKEVKEMVKIE